MVVDSCEFWKRNDRSVGPFVFTITLPELKSPQMCWAVLMPLNWGLNESSVPPLWCCSLTTLHIRLSRKRTKQDAPVSFALKWAPLLWWKMLPVSLLIAVAFSWLSVVIWRACGVKAISPACSLMLWLNKPDHCHFPSFGFMAAVKKSQEVPVITLKEKGCDCTSISHRGSLSCFPQWSTKMLYRMRSENGSEVDTVFC